MEKLLFENGVEFDLAPMTIFSYANELHVTVESDETIAHFAEVVEEAAKHDAQLISTGGEVLVDYKDYHMLTSIDSHDGKMTFVLSKDSIDDAEALNTLMAVLKEGDA